MTMKLITERIVSIQGVFLCHLLYDTPLILSTQIRMPIFQKININECKMVHIRKKTLKYHTQGTVLCIELHKWESTRDYDTYHLTVYKQCNS